LGLVLLAAVGLASRIGKLQPASPGGESLYRSAWFVALLVLLAVNLTASVCFKWVSWAARREGLIRHIGFLLVLCGAALSGALAQRGTMKLEYGKPLDAVQVEGALKPLGYSLELTGFTLERYEPKAQQILVRVPGDSREHAFPVEPGRDFPVGQTGYTIRPKRYVPDFAMAYGTKEVVSRSPEPNNPAVLVQVSRLAESFERWVFAKPQGLHSPPHPVEMAFVFRPSDPKAFKSRVRVLANGRPAGEWLLQVNRPVRFRGRTFYQMSYDPERWSWSGILVVRDPGVPVVYAGYLLIIASLILRPFLKRKEDSSYGFTLA
jgi:hypothetical protein